MRRAEGSVGVRQTWLGGSEERAGKHRERKMQKGERPGRGETGKPKGAGKYRTPRHDWSPRIIQRANNTPNQSIIHRDWTAYLFFALQFFRTLTRSDQYRISPPPILRSSNPYEVPNSTSYSLPLSPADEPLINSNYYNRPTWLCFNHVPSLTYASYNYFGHWLVAIIWTIKYYDITYEFVCTGCIGYMYVLMDSIADALGFALVEPNLLAYNSWIPWFLRNTMVECRHFYNFIQFSIFILYRYDYGFIWDIVGGVKFKIYWFTKNIVYKYKFWYKQIP